MAALPHTAPAQASRGGLIFISYSHEDHEQAAGCHRALVAMCCTLPGEWHVFLDSEGARKLKAGQEWVGRLDDELDAASVMVVLMSHAYTASRFCTDKELRRMFERRAQGENVMIIGVALHQIDPAAVRVPGRRDWSLRALQCLPQGPVKTLFGTKLGLKPLSKWDVREIEDGWATVAEQVKETLESPAPKLPQQLLTSATPPAPPRPRWKPAALAAVLVAVTVGGATLWLRDQSTTARADLRVDRADLALERLARLPAWLDVWPGLGRVRTVAELNVAGLEPKADTPTLARRLRELVAAHPDDADLRYLQARERFRQADEAGLAQSVADAKVALRLDPAHAAAHNLLGLAADLQGDLQAAQPHYRQAHTLAPDEPSYRSHLARNQLDLGEPAQALQTYQGVENRYALAPFEQALAYWALGKLPEAEQTQSRALALLDDREAMGRAVNRRSWLFVLLDPRDPTVMLSVTVEVAHQRCLVAAERQLTRALRDGSDPAAWRLPADCQGLEQIDTLMDVIDADWCRYVIHRQPALRDAAGALRRQLLQRPAECVPLLGVQTHAEAQSPIHPAT